VERGQPKENETYHWRVKLFTLQNEWGVSIIQENWDFSIKKYFFLFGAHVIANELLKLWLFETRTVSLLANLTCQRMKKN
jgi:hypothetical protein